MNTVSIIGNLTRDPEVKAAGDKSVTQLRLAYDQYGGRGFIDVAVFGKAGENAAQYLRKGRQVGVTGELRWREWEGEGGKRQAHSVVASRVDWLGAKPQGEPTPATSGPTDESGDDIPF